MVISETGRKFLRLHLIEGVGPIRFARLLAAMRTIDRILAGRTGELAEIEDIGRKTAEAIVRGRDTVDVEEEISLAERHGARIVCMADDDYPAMLKHTNDPPPVLYIRGDCQPEDAVSIAIVGSRRCSNYGREQAQRFGHGLAEAGLTVISGLARGIDAHAHRGALAAGGRTIAVQGCGLSMIYPPEHEELARQIEQNGAIISEFAMRTEPLSGNFPARNRIIAGLSLGVLVVEAANNSGALITARLAVEYSREVFALPGRVDYPNAIGTNRLIRDGGAKLVLEPQDVIEELGEVGQALRGQLPKPAPPDERADNVEAPATLTRDEQSVLEAMSGEPATPDELNQTVDMPIGRIMAALTTLQLKGLVEHLPGMMFRRRSRAADRQ